MIAFTGQTAPPDLEMLETLRAIVKPASTVYVVLRRRSRSGDTETVDLVVVSAGGTVSAIGAGVAQALGLPFDQALNGIVLYKFSVARLIALLSGAVLGIDRPLSELLKWRWI